jgi:hypothetical protein
MPGAKGSGGKRIGAGRPKGVINTTSRAVAKRVMKDSNLSPIEVMFANMIFWHRTSEHLAGKFNDLMASAKQASADGALEILDKCNGLMEQFLQARENAQKCAVDAAPYCHPRLQAVKFEGADKDEIMEITMALAKPEAEEDGEHRTYRDGYTSVVPIRRAG